MPRTTTATTALEKLEAQRRRLEREKYTENFWDFIVDVLGYTDLSPQPHKECINFLLLPGNFKLALWPRGSFKSTIITISYPLWRLAKNPDLRILIDSRKIDRSVYFLGAIKTHIDRNERFKEIFGDWKFIPGWEKDKITISTRTKVGLKEPSIIAAGIDSPVTGGHYDLIIADDLHDETNSQTEEQCARVTLHYQTLFPILEPDGQMIIIGTRWSTFDLYGSILAAETCQRF